MNINPWRWHGKDHMEPETFMKWKWFSGRGHSSWRDQPAWQRSEDVQPGRIFSTRQQARQCPWTCHPPTLWEGMAISDSPNTSHVWPKIVTKSQHFCLISTDLWGLEVQGILPLANWSNGRSFHQGDARDSHRCTLKVKSWEYFNMYSLLIF